MFLYRHIFAAVAFSFVVFLCTAIAPGSSQKLMRISFIMRRKSGSTVKAVNTVTWKRFKSTKKLSYNSSNHPKLCSFPARPQKYISNKCWEPRADSQKTQNWYLLSVNNLRKKKLTSQNRMLVPLRGSYFKSSNKHPYRPFHIAVPLPNPRIEGNS